MTKELYILISDGGDGSYYPYYTFNKEWVNEQERRSDEGELDYDSLGCDGDGFHYDTINVPTECTLQTLGISDCAE
jgi:hypothetical protein